MAAGGAERAERKAGRSQSHVDTARAESKVESTEPAVLTDPRARLLRAAFGFALVPPSEPQLRVLHRWMDCWRGVGDVVTGMNRQAYWLHLSNVDAGTWRATFSREAIISADGFGAGGTPWRAVQQAAWLKISRQRR